MEVEHFIIDAGAVCQWVKVGLSALSAITGVNRTFLYHSMELANLAPDIQKAIVDGLVPPGLTLKKLRKGVPNVWADQRKLFGFRPDPL